MVKELYKQLQTTKNVAMNISYYDFKNLPDQEQRTMVLNSGRVMNERTVQNLKYVLYEISSFTVEIIYNTSSEKVAGINVFQNKAAYAV